MIVLSMIAFSDRGRTWLERSRTWTTLCRALSGLNVTLRCCERITSTHTHDWKLSLLCTAVTDSTHRATAWVHSSLWLCNPYVNFSKPKFPPPLMTPPFLPHSRFCILIPLSPEPHYRSIWSTTLCDKSSFPLFSLLSASCRQDTSP